MLMKMTTYIRKVDLEEFGVTKEDKRMVVE
jgi:hypothetical protein